MGLTARDYSFNFNQPLRGLVEAREDDRALYWEGSLAVSVVNHAGERRQVSLDADAVRTMLARTPPTEHLLPVRPRERAPLLVEHTSANPVHPLHLAAFRGSLVGATLARVLRLVGHTVRTAYFVNDLGKQVDWALSAMAVTDSTQIPPHVRFDKAVGVLYSAANMHGAGRLSDLRRLHAAHPWLDRALTRALPTGRPEMSAGEAVQERQRLVSRVIALAESDLALVGADVDSWEWESTLPAMSLPARLEQIGLPTTVVNGVICLSLPGGLIPVVRADRTPLYFSKDVQNLLRRAREEQVVHVVGCEQAFLQRTLGAVAAAHGRRVEYVSVGSVSFEGKRSSARQNRLQVVRDVADDLGPDAFRDLCLQLVATPSSAAMDLPLVADRRIARIGRALGSLGGPCATGRPTDAEEAPLLGLLLRAPGLVVSAAERRAPHVLIALAAALATHGLRAASRGALSAAAGQHTESTLRTLVECVVGAGMARPRASQPTEEAG